MTTSSAFVFLDYFASKFKFHADMKKINAFFNEKYSDILDSSDYPTAYLYLPLYDLLIITLIIQVLVNFHWKFWFLFLVIPGYALYKGGLYLYEYVKTLSQPPQEGEQAYVPQNQSKLRGF